MKVSLFLIVTLLLFQSPSKGQVTNILEGIGINDISIQNWEEKGNFYYCLRLGDSGGLSVWKYDKYTLQPADSLSIIANGADTFLNMNTAHCCFTRDSRLHIVYRKKSILNGFISGSYYLQLDTNLNIKVPETQLPINGSWQCITLMDNGNILYTTQGGNFPETSYSMLYVIGNNGSIITADTAGILPHNNGQYVFETIPYIENKYIIIGQRLTTHTFPYDTLFDFYLTDSVMNTLDTFTLKAGNSGYPGYRFPANMVSLPSGNIIAGEPGCVGSNGYAVLLTKHYSSTRFAVDSQFYTFNYGLDNIDICHLRGSLDILKYNPYDNSIYLVSATHNNTEPLSGGCVNPLSLSYYTYRYAEITCVDTNLNLKWRKYIRFDFDPGYCVSVGEKVAIPDGREGILLSGLENINMEGSSDSLNQFVYYINGNTITDSTVYNDPTSTTVIKHSNNNIKLYPNPATELINIEDIAHEDITSVKVYDINGRSLLIKDYKGSQKHLRIDISHLSVGMYIMKIVNKDGESCYVKFIKQ